jgi:hypothetical protein
LKRSTHNEIEYAIEPKTSKGWLILISLFMPLILCFTVLASVSLGVLAAYVVVFGILATFGRPLQPEPVPVRPRLLLVPTQNHASGD